MAAIIPPLLRLVNMAHLSSKSANSDFPFTLYVLARHYTTGGTRPPFFPLGEYGPLSYVSSDMYVYILNGARRDHGEEYVITVNGPYSPSVGVVV